MITKGIKTQIEGQAALMAAIDDGNLAAEIGRGPKRVIVKETGRYRIASEIPGLFRSRLQLLVGGYAITAGEALSQGILDFIETLAGVALTADTVTYTIMSIEMIDGPTFVEWRTENGFSANFDVAYRKS